MKSNNSTTVPRLKSSYQKIYLMELLEELKLSNVHQVPKLEKIILSVGIGKNKDDKKYYEVVRNTLTRITGQYPIDRIARKSIAGFKIRAGMNKIGLSVTLRGNKMYEFLDRLINVALPRVRDFHGVSPNGFDKGGNYNLGIKEQSIFAELSFDETTTLHGLQVTFVIKNINSSHSRALLEKFKMPFSRTGGKA